MDERATFTFERAIQWNYTIIEGDAHQIANGSALFESVRQAFIDKTRGAAVLYPRRPGDVSPSPPSRGAPARGARWTEPPGAMHN